MDSTIVLMLGTVAAGVFLGFIIGKFAARSDNEEKIQEAFERGKQEGDVEKANLTVALGEELLKLRSGIHSVAQAYESTVRVMHERLGNSLRDGFIGVPGGEEVQLSLQFDPSTAISETDGAPPLSDVEDSNIQSVRHSTLSNYDFKDDDMDERMEDDVADTMVTSAVEPEIAHAKNGHAN